MPLSNYQPSKGFIFYIFQNRKVLFIFDFEEQGNPTSDAFEASFASKQALGLAEAMARPIMLFSKNGLIISGNKVKILIFIAYPYN